MDSKPAIKDIELTLTIEDPETLQRDLDQPVTQVHAETTDLNYPIDFFAGELCPHCNYHHQEQREPGCPFSSFNLDLDPNREDVALDIVQNDHSMESNIPETVTSTDDVIGELMVTTNFYPNRESSTRSRQMKRYEEEYANAGYTYNTFEGSVYKDAKRGPHKRHPFACLGCFADPKHETCNCSIMTVRERLEFHRKRAHASIIKHETNVNPTWDYFCYRQTLFDRKDSDILNKGLLDCTKGTPFISFIYVLVPDSLETSQKSEQSGIQKTQWLLTAPDSGEKFQIFVQRDTEYEANKAIPRGGLLQLPSTEWLYHQTELAEQQLISWRVKKLSPEAERRLFCFILFAWVIWYAYLEISAAISGSQTTTPDQKFHLQYLAANRDLLGERRRRDKLDAVSHGLCDCIPIDKLCGHCATPPGKILGGLMKCWSRLAIGFEKPVKASKAKKSLKGSEQHR